jgi:hypothetical protein
MNMQKGKNNLLLLLLLLNTGCVFAQIYDGITQGAKYKIYLPVTVSLEKDKKLSSAPYFSYRHDLVEWFNITPILQYNLLTESIITQVWLNVDYKKKYFLLSRSIYDSKANLFRGGLAATIKLPKNTMIDATWDNIYSGKIFCKGDRLQAVVGIAFWRIVCNAGYSMRTDPGFVSTIRLKSPRPEFNWFQLRYDGGTKTLGIGMALQFN